MVLEVWGTQELVEQVSLVPQQNSPRYYYYCWTLRCWMKVVVVVVMVVVVEVVAELDVVL